MENPTQPQQQAQRHNTFFDDLIRFTAKSAIIIFLITLGLKLVVSDFNKGLGEKLSKVSSEMGRSEARLVLTGWFIHNPEVHWKLSEISEQKFQYDRAVEHIELAIGLLDLHRADPDMRKRYQQRLDSLRTALSKQNAKN